MSYKDLAKEAFEQKTAHELTPEFFQFKEEGDNIVGRFLSKSEVTSSTNKGVYNEYLFDTDDGAIHFHCGAQFDSKVGVVLVQGKIYQITFTGKRDIGSGRRVNNFTVEEIPDPLAT